MPSGGPLHWMLHVGPSIKSLVSKAFLPRQVSLMVLSPSTLSISAVLKQETVIEVQEPICQHKHHRLRHDRRHLEGIIQHAFLMDPRGPEKQVHML